MGAHPTLADIAVMPVIVRMADLGLATMWAGRAAIGRWHDAIRAHAAYAPTYYFGSLLSERFPHLRERAALPA
jgi:glutathione S-transferase